ncbi:LOW QUALITY PROTEIN: leucine-rich repeat-containing protein 9 [Cariama cristata]
MAAAAAAGCHRITHSPPNVDQEGLKPTALEMFFSGLRTVGMKYFPNRTTLILIGQSIQKISDLGYCLLLKELIAECSVVKIDGLQKCANLQKLSLYCNEISRIENLEALAKLNLLWLNNNLIKNIEGLHTQNFQEVNLTGNLLERELAKLQMLSKTSSNKSLRSKNLETENSVLDSEDTEKTCLEKAFLQKINALEERITFQNRKVNELETAGNIHFEEGLSNNPWFSSCYIIQSRFCTWDFRSDSIMGIKINCIFRVHNQILRLKFKQKFQIFLNPFHLCNSLSICECPRTEFLKQIAKAEGKTSSGPEKSFKHGKVIIAKVFLGHSAPACAMNPIYQVNYPDASSVFRPWKCLESDASASGNEMWASSEQRNCDCSHWHYKWFVFDHELILPEYIAEFEYVTLREREDLQRDDEVLNMEPTVKIRPQIACLNEKTPIFSVAKPNISQVLTVNGNSLSTLQDISRFKTLQKLIISFNKFTSLNNIYDLPSWKYFYVRHNHVITFEGIRVLSKLQFFNLSWNQLEKSREDINILHKHTPNILGLDITHNQWLKPASFQLSVIGQLKAPTSLDGLLIANEEVAEALQYIAGLKMTQVSLLEYSRTDEEKIPILSVFPCAKILSICKNKVHSQMHHNNWYSMIIVLNLDDQLFKISNLEKSEHLRWTSFNNNNLTQIEGIESCVKFEELTLDENYVSTLDGTSKLTKLIRHTVNNNHLIISFKVHVFNLTYPHYISIENIKISSSVSLKKIYSLTELYISNNFYITFLYILLIYCYAYVVNNQEIHHLKSLTTLIILDMSRNIVWKQDHYLFVLFHLASLKALDGITVEPTEGESVKGLFGGKLTSDMVADRLEHDFTEMQELNWSAANIRAVALVLADQFRNVCSMNLQNNNLLSFSGLIFLPNANVLCPNYNHIESILLGKLPDQVTNRHQLFQKVASHGYRQGLAKGSKDAEFGENLPVIMQSLKDFHLGYNGIINMAQLLSRLKKLKRLFLQGNYISQIEGLEVVLFLQEFLLDHSCIKMISQGFLARQNGLLTLYLEQNEIELNMVNLVKLQKLFLDFNRIQGFPVANSPEDFTFLALPANFTRCNPLRITNGNLNENINHLFCSDLIFGHKLKEPLLNKSNENNLDNVAPKVSAWLSPASNPVCSLQESSSDLNKDGSVRESSLYP